MPVRASQILALPSRLPVMIRLPSGLKATLLTSSLWPLSLTWGSPVSVSQTFTVLSELPVARRVPSGVNETLITSPVCPRNSTKGVPVRTSQTLAVLSSLPVAIRLPSELKETASTDTTMPFEFDQWKPRPGIPNFGRAVRTSSADQGAIRTEADTPYFASMPGQVTERSPVRASQTLALRSELPVTIRVPSGLNETLSTSAKCPRRSNTNCPVRASQTFAVRSELPLAIRCRPG